MTIVDSTTLLRRTPAGDAEAAVPAGGLSITQRRLLTLLATPRTLGELPLAPGLDAARLRRAAVRLAQAGFISCEATATAEIAHAANAAVAGEPPVRGFAHKASAVALAIAVGVLVWGGWRLSAAPHADGKSAALTAKPRTANAPSAALPEPAVIATRVLRGDPQERAKDAHAPKPSAASPNAEFARTTTGDAMVRATSDAAARATSETTARATSDATARTAASDATARTAASDATASPTD